MNGKYINLHTWNDNPIWNHCDPAIIQIVYFHIYGFFSLHHKSFGVRIARPTQNFIKRWFCFYYSTRTILFCNIFFFFTGNFQLGTASDVLLIYRGFSLFSQLIFAHFFQKFSSFFSFFSSVHLAPSKFIWPQSKELFHFFAIKRQQMEKNEQR